MIKVKIIFKDGTLDEFFAEESYASYAEGKLILWTSDKGDIISYPTNDIKKIIEMDIE